MMPETVEGSWLTRLEKLEQANRRVNRLWGTFVLVAVATLLMGQTAPVRKIEADEFVLVDSAGNERANLGFHFQGPRLALKDHSGVVRLDLTVGSDGPYVRLWDANGKPRALLAVKDGLGPVIFVSDAEEKAGAIIGFDRANPHIALYAADGVLRAGMNVTPDLSRIFVVHPDPKRASVFGSTREGAFLSLNGINGSSAQLKVLNNEPTLQLLDQNEKVMVELSRLPTGPALRLFDENEQVRAALSVHEDGSQLNLFDPTTGALSLLTVLKGYGMLLVRDQNGKEVSVPRTVK